MLKRFNLRFKRKIEAHYNGIRFIRKIEPYLDFEEEFILYIKSFYDL